MSVISKNKYDVGLTNILYKIFLPKWNPMSGYIPRMTPAMVNVVNEELEKLKAEDFIEPSISSFLSPMVCSKKTDRVLQVCIDLQMVFKDVTNNMYPFLQNGDQLQAMSGAKWFTTLNLKKNQMKYKKSLKRSPRFNPKKAVSVESFANGV